MSIHLIKGTKLHTRPMCLFNGKNILTPYSNTSFSSGYYRDSCSATANLCTCYRLVLNSTTNGIHNGSEDLTVAGNQIAFTIYRLLYCGWLFVIVSKHAHH